MDQIEAAMTPKYLTGVLNAPVEKVKVTSGSNPGDNYMCVLYGIEVELSSGQKRHLVVKAYPNLAARQQILEMSNIFLKEFLFYDFWMPTLKKVGGKNGSLDIAAPIYLDGAAIDHSKPKQNAQVACTTTKEFRLENFLLMEDIRVKGFKMANRMKGLDTDHCKLIVAELAKFHALGWAYKQKNGYPLLQDKYPYMVDSMFNSSMMDNFKPLMDTLLQSSRDMTADTFGSDSEISANYNKFLENDNVETMKKFLDYNLYDMDSIESILRVKSVLPENFCKDAWLTTCHGDCWVNNFLFRYHEGTGKPSEVCLVDFQLIRESCPTTDLAYFLYTSVDGPTRKASLKDLLKLYHDTFATTCSNLEVETLPGFSFESLLIRFRQAKIFGMMISLPLLFAVLKNPEKAEDLDTMELEDVGDIFAKGMNLNDENLSLKQRLGEIVEELYNDGVF